MNGNGSAVTWRVGFWGAVFSALFSLLYIAVQLAEWAGVLGSAGGPESASTPLGIALLLTTLRAPGSLLPRDDDRAPAPGACTSHGLGPRLR